LCVMVGSVEVEREGVAAATPSAFCRKPITCPKTETSMKKVLSVHTGAQSWCELRLQMIYRTAMAFAVLAILIVPRFAVAQAPTMTLTQNLAFGTITGTTNIYYTNNLASAFQMNWPTYSSGPSNTITFVLSGNSNLTDGYGDNLPISFNSTNYGAYNVGTNSKNGVTTFNPYTGINTTASANAHTDYFWVGATVTPGNNYVAATYSGTITVTVTVTYNGQNYYSYLTIPVTATLQGNVSLTATGSLNFNPVVAGVVPPVLSASASGAPEFTAGGVRNGTSTVTFSNTTLTGPGGATLTFYPSVIGSGTNSQSGATSITSGSHLNTGSGSNHNYYFWLGGSLGSTQIPTTQSPGSYSGTFVLSVTY